MIFDSTGIYTDVVTSAIGCDSVITIDLTVNSVDVSTSQTDNVLSANETGASYIWLNCPELTIIEGETDQTYNATANGSYAVVVSNEECSDTSECMTASSVGIQENNFGQELSVYPNPTNGQFNIDMGSNYKLINTIIIDITGKLVQSNTYPDLQLLDIKLAGSAGIYFLEIESTNRKVVIRIVKN